MFASAMLWIIGGAMLCSSAFLTSSHSEQQAQLARLTFALLGALCWVAA